MKPIDKIHPDWKLEHLFKDQRWKKLQKVIQKEPFYPKAEDIFSAFSISPNDVKAIIIGMSPYKGDFANGHAFATDGRNTPSLQIIHDALWWQYNDISVDKDSFDNTLTHWINQGVLLLNAALTVPKTGTSEAHGKYWKWFIQGVLDSISSRNIPTARVGYLARELNIGHNKFINTCHPMKTYYEYYKKSCDYSKLYYNDNFVYHKMFLWFDNKNANVQWLK